MDRNLSITIGIFLCFMLVGCRADIPPATQGNWFSYENNEYDYSIQVPEDGLISWKGKTPTDGLQVGFGTYPILTTPELDDYDISLRIIPDAICGSQIMGASQTNEVTAIGKETVWGKVDFWDVNHTDYIPGTEPICRPMGGPTGVGYALCSERKGKTVVICISQAADNPTLARQIFETFRWTD